MPSTPQHSIAFEPCHIGPSLNPGNQANLGSMPPTIQPESMRPHVEDLDFPMAPALPKIKNNDERPVPKRINSAGAGQPKVSAVLLSMKERFFFLGPTSFGEILCWMLWLGKDFPKL